MGVVGTSVRRVDAYDKVTGRAKYTDDLLPADHLVARVLHSTIANGRVKAIHSEKAAALAGVVKIVTCFEVPDLLFPTPGHPWSRVEAKQDVCDRLLLHQRVRQYGDDIAAVVAVDELTAERALRLLEVEYEEYPVVTTPEQAMAEEATQLHEGAARNILRATGSEDENFAAVIQEPGLVAVEGQFLTQVVQHCHLENPVSYAYMEAGRIVVVSSTQIPHIVRRVIGQALGIPWGQVRVIKPYIGGGFGNKQEVLYEPLNAYLTTQVGGRCVKLELTREETFTSTRSRHSIGFAVKTWAKPDGTLMARQFSALSNQGGYASHGHSIVANSMNGYRHIYPYAANKAEAKTIYTNIGTGGAMRGYGIPQTIFAAESHMDDLALALGLDPIELRLKNIMREGYVDPHTGIACRTSGLAECIEYGRQYMDWDNKRKLYAQPQTGNKRRGIGMAIFSYKTGVHPISLETSSARLILNQDGSVQLQLGATEIGQGGDTVFCQMAAEVLDLPMEDVHIVTVQDTDVAPFDTGAYASRQTYVTGLAVKQTSELLRTRILEYAAIMLEGKAPEGLDLKGSYIVDLETGEKLLPLSDVALEAFYSLETSRHLTAESTYHCDHNTFAFGACFVELEVDLPLGKVEVLKIIGIHDSGRIINPALAEGQVHGGLSMGLGYGLSEQMLFNDQGKLLNGNLLDYKLPTAMDTPRLQAHFVETEDPSGPFGNKALGEPPGIPPAAAIRNALLQATGVAFDTLPLNPQVLVKAFAEAGLLDRGEEGSHV